MKKFKFNKPLVESHTAPQDINTYWVDVDESTEKVLNIKKYYKGNWIEYLIQAPEPNIYIGPPNNQIWYNTDDGKIFNIEAVLEKIVSDGISYLGPKLLSNEWDNTLNKFVMKFDADITALGLVRNEDMEIQGSYIMLGDSALGDGVGSAITNRFTNLELPNSITTIGGQSIVCEKVSSLILPNSVDSISLYAFVYCNHLSHLTIPESIKKIEANAFIECPNLTYITFLGTKEQWKSIELVEIKSGDDILTFKDSCPVSVIHCSDGDVNLR